MSDPAMNSLSAYLAWRDGKIALGEFDANPFMIWSAGVRFAALTDAERQMLQTVHATYENLDDDEECATIAMLIEGLLARLGGDA
jgi:hypothetical protein